MKKTQARLMGETLAAVRLPCAGANLRRAARVATQLYEEALRPSGVRATQFTLLQALQLAPGISQKQLGELLGIDSTTLTRTLAGLRRKGWLRSQPGEDRRELRLSLTPSGLQKFRRVAPYWEAAQKRLRQVLGGREWNRVIDAAVRIAEVVPKVARR
jgi:DNA-binding MarR family transcriptional regulator